MIPAVNVFSSYSPLNLPAHIEGPDYEITYVYTADGVKMQQIITANEETTTMEYAGSLNFIDGELKRVRHAYGELRKIGEDFEPIYQINDHLGNTRVVFWDEDCDGEISGDEVIERIDYYPFGLEHQRPIDEPEEMETHYRYTGQEHGPAALPYYDYISRQYDPALGRFLGVDDHFFNYPSYSPYVYVGNNPIIMVDPDGRDWYRSQETGQYVWYKGSGERDGYDHYGPNIWLRGENGYLYHQQNNYIETKSERELNRHGNVFMARVGGNQETKDGKAMAYTYINDVFTMFSFQGAYANANPRNIRSIFAKLSNIFAAWETGHHLGNEFNTSKPENLFSPPFIFTWAPAHDQLQMSTIRSLSDKIHRSDEYQAHQDYL